MRRLWDRVMAMFGRRQKTAEMAQVEELLNDLEQQLKEAEAKRRQRQIDARIAVQRAGQR